MTLAFEDGVTVRVILIALLAFVPMILEARRASRNERLLRARGGIEPAGDVYRLMQIAYPGVFVAMLAESVIRHRQASPWLMAAGLALFLCGKAMKWWAIVSLGPFWTFRIIVLPGSTPVRSGPYRLTMHPNYVGVMGELLGAACMSAAVVSGPIGTVLFALLMLMRVAVENRARDAILRRT